MNKKFLYSKPSIIGVLDSGNDEFNDIGSWLFDDSPALLRKKFREDSLDELVMELIDIFREGNPNYQELAGLFGLVKIEEDEQEGLKIWNVRNIERLAGDLNKIEMHIDAQSLIINKLYLYINELSNLQTIKQKLNDKFEEVSYQDINGGLIFNEKELIIGIIKVPEEK
ncbi:hypothetical protein [Brevibacillus brevis]|uniref:hypothetical protein n=1 Tax=Brevibacillus brevis TaxID=1393 RepID=UPI000D114DA1|nr:hypothetical protein [Brevibacillus brevis]PSJ59232.1 hypothetical protein C7J99_31900 [Brevibacillus brevis]RED27341.1 hypothetical protein DES34_11027 [Brevibacillus brevis]GEC93523.1 hypothetical protein BBR01nite_58540 [Brevibacillus brevis]VEF91193.1 Uncharacterised protein [Brevibacillus brevis]